MSKYLWDARWVTRRRKTFAKVACLVCDWAHEFKPGAINELSEAFDWAKHAHGGVHRGA